MDRPRIPLIKAENISKQFRVKGKQLNAVQDISMSIHSGEIFGIGGESGCGKSTVAKMLMGFFSPSQGSIDLSGVPLADLLKQSSQAWRRQIQMIFQHPASSLHPRMTIEQTLSEPFAIHDIARGKECRRQIVDLLNQVGLSENKLPRYPHELSGGQKQRVAIARAMATHPKIIICDEPFSALDVSIQAQIINLLVKLQKEQHLSYLVISHDLSILHYLCDKIAIMYLGSFMEYGTGQDIYHNPLHPYTQELISSILLPEPPMKDGGTQISIKKDILGKEAPSLFMLSKGCPYVGRCPHARDICHLEKPQLREIKQGHFAACHLIK